MNTTRRYSKMPGILVVGSSNTDMVIKTSHLPRPGETVMGGSFMMSHGGKGANQAVAAARLYEKVSFICKTGYDSFGKKATKHFKKEGINMDNAFTDGEHPSGVAIITVDDQGENCIVVAPGTNALLTPANILSVKKAIKEAELILLQLEIPMETVECVIELAREYEKMVILNPAPAQHIPPKLLDRLFMITPNEIEAEMLTGIPVVDAESAEQAARKLRSMGVEVIVITMGAKGAFIYYDGRAELIPAYKVDAVDTTGAGDVFNGALAVAITENVDFQDAVRFASKAAAISVLRMGAQDSAPYRHELSDID